MSLIYNSIAFIGVVWRRVVSHFGLLLAVWAGFTLAVALVVSIPVYAEAAGYRILQANLAKSDVHDPLPPFSLIYTFGGASDPNLTWAQYERADTIAQPLGNVGIDLPTQRKVRYVATDQLRALLSGTNDEIWRARIAYASDVESEMQLVDGDWPKPWSGSGPIDVLVPLAAANKQTLLVDDRYVLHSPPVLGADLNITVRVAGIWRPLNEQSTYWFYPPETFNTMMFVPAQTFTSLFAKREGKWVRAAAWYTAIDLASVRGADVPFLTQQIGEATKRIDEVLPGIKLSRSPVEQLETHRQQVRVLTVTLALFSVPLLGLVVYFLMGVASMLAQRQLGEVAVLRSRGSSRVEVLALALGEGVAVGLAALIVGLPLGVLMAQLILWTQSFLRWAPMPGPSAGLLRASWWQGAVVVLLAVLAILIPAFGGSRRTIISYKQEQARSIRRPLWQRLFLDILLLVPALYGYQQLRLNGKIGVPGAVGAAFSPDDPFRNPLLMLAPSLLVFALALVSLRLIPRILVLLGRVIDLLPGVSTQLALRYLTRTTKAFSGPILLISLTLSLAAFTASMARTLDQHSEERARYSAGADLRLVYGGKVASGTDSSSSSSSSGVGTEEVASQNLEYLLVPPDEYLKFPGVNAVTRVASSTGFIAAGGGPKMQGKFIGVDRQTLPLVLRDAWRDSYAGESLGALMNRLGADPAAAIVPAKWAADRNLKIGDRLTISLNDLGAMQDIPFFIAATVNNFPTLYNEDGLYVIGNLDYSQEQQGGAYPYEIWLDTQPGVNTAPIAGEAYGYDLMISPTTPDALLAVDLLRPERQGLFGLLSVGFLAASLVTIIGFLAHTLLSFQRRLVELGMLRAIGLSTRQLAALLVLEQAIVIGVGTLVGTILGVLVSRLFVPFLQVRTGDHPDTPPFIVQLAWSQIAIVYVVAAALLVLAVVLTLLRLRRLRLFEAVKLGEAVS